MPRWRDPVVVIERIPNVNQITMKTLPRVSLAAVAALSATFLVGCTSVTIPPAKGYAVLAGGTVYQAKTVRIHGSWAELQTDSGPVWASGAVIKPEN